MVDGILCSEWRKDLKGSIYELASTRGLRVYDYCLVKV
jgi:hypothetical protein